MKRAACLSLVLLGCGSASGPLPVAEPIVEDASPIPSTEAEPRPLRIEPIAEPEAPEPTEPTAAISGIPRPLAGVYDDLGPAKEDDRFRALIAFPTRDAAALKKTIDDLYNPASASFRKYLDAATWIDRHAPLAADVDKVKEWLTGQGFKVPRVARNRLLLEVTGTAAQFRSAFGCELHVFTRKSPQVGNPDHEVYGTVADLTVPKFVANRISAVLTADRAAAETPLPAEAGSIETKPPADAWMALTPANVARTYGFSGDGAGSRIGVVVGAAFKLKDLDSFWGSFGIKRDQAEQFPTMEPPSTRYLESTLDVEWAGAMAPGAELRVYQGPDARNTSMIYTFNEAIARNEIDVLTDSFAHREDAEPRAVRLQYDASAAMAAALGITVVAAGGDSAGCDVPAVSPYVTSVGGTVVRLNADGSLASEIAWSKSGSGDSLSFDRPSWQSGVLPTATKRATSDVALNAGAGYWTYYLGTWERWGGTSFGAPVFAAGVAVINSHRRARGLPRVGWLNRTLYETTAAQKAFRDITTGATADHSAQVGWDHPTGWGAPDIAKLSAALP
jgi:kumamolisin